MFLRVLEVVEHHLVSLPIIIITIIVVLPAGIELLPVHFVHTVLAVLSVGFKQFLLVLEHQCEFLM